MDRDPIANRAPATSDFADVWRDDRAYVVGLASRMLGDPAEAEDIVQEAFDRLTRVELDEIDDVRGWLAVVVRRLCLDRIRSARSRRESAFGANLPEAYTTLQGNRVVDPADRITLDDQVQLALAVVLDRLTPAERTAFVLHDVFGFPFAAIGEIVGRTPTACRQLASRARRLLRSTDPPVRKPEGEATSHQALADRFIAACEGGDISELVATLDPDIDGEATLLGFGPLVRAEGRPAIAQRLLGLFGPGTDAVLVPVTLEHEAGLVAFVHGRMAAIVRLTESGGLIRHIHSVVIPPT
jgi:RNA polymerase sigma-70 factor, ECF subfamily